ncbi:MAG: hypothetical protein M0P61_00205 [Ignavibacteriaceae bacterium]|nr:hypothetical protein [Ignavibacteriaceae bacterium]
MKKLLISILAFIFSPIINTIKEVGHQIIERNRNALLELSMYAEGKMRELMERLEKIEQRQLETNYFIGGVAATKDEGAQLGIIQVMGNLSQQLNHIGRKATMPLIFTAKGLVLNVLQCKKIMFECNWDNINVMRFLLMVDGTNADTFEYNFEKISLDPGFEKSEDKPVFDFARVFLKKHTTLTNGKKNISIIDHIAIHASRLLISYVPQRDILYHAEIDMICFRSIISAVTPFYEKEKADSQARDKAEEPKEIEQPKEEQNSEEKVEQTNIFPLNDAGRTDVAEQSEKSEQKEQ